MSRSSSRSWRLVAIVGALVVPSIARAAGLDLAIDTVAFDAATRRATLSISNLGTRAARGAELVIYSDADGDGAASDSEEIARQTVPDMQPSESLVLSIAWPYPPLPGGEPAIAVIVLDGDGASSNNRRLFVASDDERSGAIINEILADPLLVDGESGAEYVEIFNAGNRRIETRGWELWDGLKRQTTLPSGSPALDPGEFLLIASDSSIYHHYPWLVDSSMVVICDRSDLGLNNAGDVVRIVGRDGVTIDSVAYDEEWHWRELDDTRGRSLERISATEESNVRANWSSSVASAGGTPAAANTRSIAPQAPTAELEVTPVTVSPDNDGFEDFTRISYRLPSVASRIVVEIFDRQGRRLRRLAENQPAGTTGELIWDGLDDVGLPLRQGVYIVRLEAYESAARRLSQAQRVVVVAAGSQ